MTLLRPDGEIILDKNSGIIDKICWAYQFVAIQCEEQGITDQKVVCKRFIFWACFLVFGPILLLLIFFFILLLLHPVVNLFI